MENREQPSGTKGQVEDPVITDEARAGLWSVVEAATLHRTVWMHMRLI